MRAPSTRTLYDRQQAILRQVSSLARDPSEWEPLDLTLLTQLEHMIDLVRGKVIIGLRDSGATDADIAAALGITRQAVSKRWPGGGRYVGAAGRYRSAVRVSHDDS